MTKLTPDLPELLLSIRFTNPEQSFFLENQMMNDNWEFVTQIIIWSLEFGFIVPIEEGGDYKYECKSLVVEQLIRKLLAFGRGRFFNRQGLETQAVMAAAIDKSTSYLPPPTQKPVLSEKLSQTKRKNKK